MTHPVFVLNGPSLNLLGVREPEVYGSTTLAQIEEASRQRAESRGLTIPLFGQSNYEGQLIDWIHQAREAKACVIINPGAWATTSVALADSLKVLDKPVIEVHLSNIHRREGFQHGSLVSKFATGVVAGLGHRGYLYAVDALADLVV
ncbi:MULTISPECIES: type II 3-dehydroquinate dehydratase [unclassified Aureimonas]|uniref:type II 3-dehydroquinate dehydratase n=1 Tax=unclassified Aureimonas TaxID=2615206 RepID=UPI000B334652|nr:MULTISPECIES: type II 3-dehydroquinate dehydratase [unclassified Aureimonas]